jgi:hypothetical protein
MADINPNWARWIAASLAVYYKVVADALNIELLVEGVDERESEKMEADRAELRVNGPFINQWSRGDFQLDVDSNILLTDLMAGEGENSYNLMTWAGYFQQAAEKSIPVYRYGPDTGGVDDGSWVGCLTVRDRKKGPALYHFGQISTNDRVRQAAVDTQHRMFLTVSE